MINLNKNIISEMMKKIPANTVIQWMDQQEVTELFVTTIALAEIAYGINALPKGARRVVIENAFDKTIQASFKHRILPFDERTTHHYGVLMGKRNAAGHPLSILDGQIAALALTHNAAIATRNVRDFKGCNIDLINPLD